MISAVLEPNKEILVWTGLRLQNEAWVTRGNHHHHTKTEKFFVVEGDGLIRMRAIGGGPVHEYPLTGKAYQVIDNPPGFTYSIRNVGLEKW